MFGIHWIPTHRGNLGQTPDRDIFARWNPGMVKIITVDNKVPYLEDVPPGALIVVRNHPLSEDGNRGAEYNYVEGSTHPAGISLHGTARPSYRAPEAVEVANTDSPAMIGKRHAEMCLQMALYCESQGVPRSRLLFEGLNEPNLWAGEPPEWTAAYYRAFLIWLHYYNLRGVVGNFGVGWPGNGGVEDAPVAWDFWKPVVDAMYEGDYLGLHEYWALNGPQENWRWWGGRFLQCPFDVPILITENGIDTGVTGNWYGGWGDLPGTMEQKAARYTYELVWYAEQCAKDGRVAQVFPFTYDIGSPHWEKFDIRNEPFLNKFLGAQAAWPEPGKVVAPPPVVINPPPVVTPPQPAQYRIDRWVVKRDPNAGLSYVYGRALQPNGEGWANKAVRFYWRGNAELAGQVVTRDTGHFSVEFPERSVGQFDFELYDPVRGIKSERLQLDIDHEQVEIAFKLVEEAVSTPDEPTESNCLRFARPVVGGYVSQHFGNPNKIYTAAGFVGHEGLDYGGLPVGAWVYASAPGKVIWAGNTGNAYGNHVVINHEDTIETWYCHLSAVTVHNRQLVQRGDIIGRVGATGRVNMAPHLHFAGRVIKLIGVGHPQKGFVDMASYRYTHGA